MNVPAVLDSEGNVTLRPIQKKLARIVGKLPKVEWLSRDCKCRQPHIHAVGKDRSWPDTIHVALLSSTHQSLQMLCEVRPGLGSMIPCVSF